MADQRPDPCKDRAEWLRRKSRIWEDTAWAFTGAEAHRLTEVVLGCPCPPEPPPPPEAWASDYADLEVGLTRPGIGDVLVTMGGESRALRLPEADEFADAIKERVRWVREQGGEDG